jgi:hypothetical protein
MAEKSTVRLTRYMENRGLGGSYGHYRLLSRVTAELLRWQWMGLLALTGCVANDDTKPKGAATELIEARSKILCRKTFECCSAVDIAINSAQSEAECVAMDSGLYLITDSVAAGTETVDWPLAQSCFATIAAMNCDEWAQVLAKGVPAGCKDILRGTLGTGELCQNAMDCVSDSCGPHTNTKTGVNEYRCDSHVAAVGEFCEVDSDEYLDCRAPAYCDFHVFGDTVCRERLGTNATCSNNEDCVSGLCEALQCQRACYADPTSSLLRGE